MAKAYTTALVGMVKESITATCERYTADKDVHDNWNLSGIA